MSVHFLPSEDDAATLYPGRALADYAAELFAGGARAVVLKKARTAPKASRATASGRAFPRIELRVPTRQAPAIASARPSSRYGPRERSTSRRRCAAPPPPARSR